MDTSEIKLAAQQLLAGEISSEELFRLLDQSRSAQLDAATLDLDRARRCGFPEVIYAAGKTTVQITEIVERLLQEKEPILITRLVDEQANALKEKFSQAVHNEPGRTIRISAPAESEATESTGEVAVITAGTSDLPVAEEARETLMWMGIEATSIRDVGVAGPQRLLQHVPTLQKCDAVVVAAGMEGALPSVVGGHVSCPVVAVPTSVGYGASFGGVAALLSMLNSCAANVTVVNIDAGFKAGYVAGLIAHKKKRAGDTS